ncbi:MAG: ATP-binding protein, partial [Bacteroidota bacterium]|nr:ATP-binding protein [Bacteroidota bacterium]
MPTLTKEPLQKDTSLFIGLQSYTEAQSDIFYGRDEEIDRLTNLVKANTLTIVFGKSGTGKTSLLNAGVFPRLRKDYCLPFRIRLEFRDDSPGLVTQIKNILKSEIDKYGFKVEAYPSTETLWEYFHREPLWNSVTPILIFDQFEEIFTLGKKSDHFGASELADFWEELADVIENSIPEKLKDKFLNDKENVGYNYKIQKVKTLFAFREEFLPEFEGITSKIPSIKYSRFRLLPMNGNQAYEVITRTWKTAISAKEAHNIVGFFASEEDRSTAYELIEIEPSLLSQVCSFIDKERRMDGSDNISAEFLDKYPKEKILRSIYDEVLTESNVAVIGALAEVKTTRPVNEFVEEKLITDEGYRTKYALNEQDEKIRPGVEVLKAKYFVRDDGKSVELTHDVLTPLIKRDREERRKGLAMVLAKKKANRRAVFIIVLAAIAALLFWFLSTNKARQDNDKAQQETRKAIQEKEEAINLKASLVAQIKKDSASLATIKANLNRLKNAKGDSSNGGGDTTLNAILLKQRQRDSIDLAALTNQKAALEKNISSKNAIIDSLTNKQRQAVSTGIADKRYIASLQRRTSADSSRLAFLQNAHNDLIKKYNDYINQVSKQNDAEDITDVADTSTFAHSDTSSLKLNLYYSLPKSSKAKVPNNLKIYLIPDGPANKRIIREASAYEIRCDELNLDRAKDKRIAKYKNGTYV